MNDENKTDLEILEKQYLELIEKYEKLANRFAEVMEAQNGNQN